MSVSGIIAWGEAGFLTTTLQMRKARPEPPGLGSSGVQQQRGSKADSLSLGLVLRHLLLPFPPEGWACWPQADAGTWLQMQLLQAS